jgi:hypothetical protein
LNLRIRTRGWWVIIKLSELLLMKPYPQLQLLPDRKFSADAVEKVIGAMKV